MVSAASYLEQLKPLTNGDLAARANSLFLEERRGCARVIAHLAEIERRRAYLPLGYSGLFDYCVKKLGVSEGGAWTRGQVARASLRVPALLEAIAAGKISLTVAGKLAKHLTLENFREVLDDCAGMTKREVEEYLVRLVPKPPVTPGIRPSHKHGHSLELSGAESCGGQPELEAGDGSGQLPTPTLEVSPAASEAISATAGGLDFELNTDQGVLYSEGCEPRSDRPPLSADAAPRGRVEPCQPETYNVRFAVSRGFKDKLERLAEVLGVPSVEAQLAEVLEQALDMALDKKDPQRRHQRRQERLARKEAAAAVADAATGGPPPAETSHEPSMPEQTNQERSRDVPIALRDAIFERAGHCCEYVAPDGTRCATRVGLTVDHCHPFACDGTHDEENLRAYCWAHNQWWAEEYFGSEFIQRQIERRRASDDGVREATPIYGEQQSVGLQWSEERSRCCADDSTVCLASQTSPRPDEVKARPRGPSSLSA